MLYGDNGHLRSVNPVENAIQKSFDSRPSYILINWGVLIWAAADIVDSLLNPRQENLAQPFALLLVPMRSRRHVFLRLWVDMGSEH